ncbi:hypothetical protein [Sorangium sp. So ce394]|uniref:hypothetical protein n=1 Tax=Sorangium sp. So ce394 TaxID=3133310 RepID=UPI003F5B8CA7
MPSLEPCHLIANRPDYVVAIWRQIFCAIWRRETTEDAVRRVTDACVAFANQHPRGIGLLAVIDVSEAAFRSSLDELREAIGCR